jgi:3-hydroxy acid dehydrogenase/malonic semialdehyde reductase
MLFAPLRKLNTVKTHLRYFTTAMTSSGPISILGTQRLVNKNVLITGASGGIGRSTALLFARTGANVILCARRKEALDTAVKECQEAYKAQGSVGGSEGGHFASIVMDMRDRNSINEILPSLPKWAQGKVDILVANAGLVRGKDKVGDIDLDEIDEMLETNVRGFIQLNQIFVREFKKQNSGHLITIGSIAGREAYPGGSIYCATKFAVNAFTSSLLKELVHTPVSGSAGFKIRCCHEF